ncbi:PAS domain-containing hybrid sensor histidine kinase/response regulator [Sphingomonas radiodurans]|uniref:PAS domain-containing hybrid sensor histidine kinase/response regulator n=1 Tax=Sphingomonas radiodurans TaxID=2890321 RepID=UPI001E299BDB|nr:PAS domain-containing protein [Sphingomonas radiodurans]WBH17718.1 PAS domain-containing protein [Sphingomonas radiodurans]
MPVRSNAASSNGSDFMTGGEMGAIMRAHDWTTSPLGTPDAWPQSLRAVVGLMLGSQFPMFVAWGDELGFLYNDAYAEILGSKHPQALGARFSTIWAEIWSDISPLIDAAMAGEATYHENLPLIVNRGGFDEQAFFTFSYSPVRDESGAVAGMFCAVTETTAQILSERRIKDERERQRHLFEQAPGFITILSGPEHRFEFVNAAYNRLFGARDFVGRTVREVFPDLAGQPFFDLLDTSYSKGERFIARATPVRLQETPDAEPTERFLDFIYEPVRDSDGAVTGLFVEGYDVTDAHRTREALLESEARLKLALEAGRLAEVTITLPNKFVHSSTFAELLGHPPEKQVTLAEFRAQYHPDDHDRVVALRAEILGSAETFYEIEKRIIRPDGEVRWVYGRGGVQRDEDGRALSLTAVYLDDSDRKLAEIALQESEARLRAVLDAAPVGLLFSDSSGNIIGGNAHLQEIIGKPITLSHEIKDYRDDYVAFHADGRQVESDDYPLAQVLKGEADRAELEVQVQLPDQSLRWVRYIATTIRDAGSQLLGAVVASLDIERDKRFTENLAQEVERAVAELEAAQEALRQSQKMEAMGALTGGVAHDFNNLLSPIIGGLDLLQRRGVGDERAQRMIAGALQSAERAKTLVQRLLAFARRQPLQPTAVDMRALVEGMADLVASTTGPQVHVVVEVATDLPPAKADANQVEMALLNLAVNARDAMPGGGTLTITAAEKAVGPGHRANLMPGNYVRLLVSDTGIGMDAETLRRAVEPFYSTKGVGQGTGLGLSMVHGLAAQLRGGLHIDSQVGLGTTVELWLPVANTASPAQPKTVGADAAAVTGTALLVDDEELVRSSTAEMLLDLGLGVVEATSAEGALRLLEDGLSPDILITDHLMPNMTGTELAREARDRLPGVPVLVISGYAAVDGLAPDLARLTKPFRRADLAAAIAELMPRVA